LILALSPITVVHAQAVRSACHVDTLCQGVESGQGRIMKCLRAHKTELSQTCLAAIGRSVMNWGNRGGGAGGPGGEGPMGGGPNGPGPNGPGPGGPGQGGPGGMDDGEGGPQ
ncbi:MAG: hypothetical protein JO107_06825, partial [Hyphomicrobiales bacterium]|nr:hypothetical protein [Hyphomicrobiales bacterium]